MASSADTFLIELPYRADSAELFEAVADRPWSQFLDSAGCGGERGRYDIIVSDPRLTLVTEGDWTSVTDRAGNRQRYGGSPVSVLRTVLGNGPSNAAPADLPFCGGAVGYFSYDLARNLGELMPRWRAETALPPMAVGIYDWSVVTDHRERRCWLASLGGSPDLPRWARLFSVPITREREPLRATAPISYHLDKAGYLAQFARIRAYLEAGDCYQVNFAQQFSTRVAGDPWAGYRRLRAINPAPFSAYLNTPAVRVLSASPERFLLCREGRVETRPIKGTRPRATDPTEDRRLADELRRSVKDRAENIMIVDLLRNDLGKNCRIGSVQVPELFAIESFSSVHHLVSTVTGALAPNRDPLDLLAGAFPGGSITGAPKRRAMAIIEELETEPRGLYCGAIGYLGFDGRLDTNIAIRTITLQQGRARFAAGGGIVMDSRPEDEYHESLVKARRLFELFGFEPQ